MVLSNLFVCDASVFPTAVGVNPQITVMTLASMVASRIIKDWSEKYSQIPVKTPILAPLVQCLNRCTVLKRICAKCLTLQRQSLAQKS